jgi:hypothetical protein
MNIERLSVDQQGTGIGIQLLVDARLTAHERASMLKLMATTTTLKQESEALQPRLCTRKHNKVPLSRLMQPCESASPLAASLPPTGIEFGRCMVQ